MWSFNFHSSLSLSLSFLSFSLSFFLSFFLSLFPKLSHSKLSSQFSHILTPFLTTRNFSIPHQLGEQFCSHRIFCHISFRFLSLSKVSTWKRFKVLRTPFLIHITSNHTFLSPVKMLSQLSLSLSLSLSLHLVSLTFLERKDRKWYSEMEKESEWVSRWTWSICIWFQETIFVKVLVMSEKEDCFIDSHKTVSLSSSWFHFLPQQTLHFVSLSFSLFSSLSLSLFFSLSLFLSHFSSLSLSLLLAN